MTNNNETPVQEEVFWTALGKKALKAFTVASAATAGVLVTIFVLSEVAKPKLERDNREIEALEAENKEAS